MIVKIVLTVIFYILCTVFFLILINSEKVIKKNYWKIQGKRTLKKLEISSEDENAADFFNLHLKNTKTNEKLVKVDFKKAVIEVKKGASAQKTIAKYDIEDNYISAAIEIAEENYHNGDYDDMILALEYEYQELEEAQREFYN